MKLVRQSIIRSNWKLEQTAVRSPDVAPMQPPTAATLPLRLGIRANIVQFALLMLINACVGGMVGLERTVVPLIGTEEFGLLLNTTVVRFIISFGVVKACMNLVSGVLADHYGRKRILVLGWLLGLPVPFMIIWAPSWGWIVAANVLLGINQGLCWSMAVIMKIDLAGPRQRGLAMGLNEFAGYGAVGLAAFASGYLASRYGLRPVPFYLGIAFAALGLILSVALVRDTTGHARLEARDHKMIGARKPPAFSEVFAKMSYRNPTLFSVSQAGLIDIIQIEHISFSLRRSNLYEAFGIRNGGYYLVRPDMYIAYRSTRFDEQHLKAFLESIGLKRII